MRAPIDPEVATACHEAGHAVARFLLHGTTGAISSAPMEGKLAGAESHPLPAELLTGTKLVDGPYTPPQRQRLIKEIKTTLAGCVVEGMLLDRPPLDVLDDAASSSDFESVWGFAGRLWTGTDERDREVAALAEELVRLFKEHWPQVEIVAEAYLKRGALTADEVHELLAAD